MGGDAAWLAGFLDGEGYVGAYQTKSVNGRSYYTATCTVRNTHRPTMLRVAELFTNVCGSNNHLSEQQPARGKLAYYTHVGASDKLLKLAETVLPYAVTKRDQWLLVAEYTTSRITNAHKGYSPRELEIVVELAALNERWKEKLC